MRNRDIFSPVGIEKDFERTIRGFEKERRKIERRFGSKKPRRIWVRIVLAVLGLFMLLVLLPPHTIPVEGRLTSIHFFRSNPFVNDAWDIEFHAGIDLAAPMGTPVRASAWGRVVETGWSDVYGNWVLLRHPLGLRSFYAHLSVIRVNEGAFLFGGAVVGEVGSTGRSTGPHLHFEIRGAERSWPPRFFLFFHSLRRMLIGV